MDTVTKNYSELDEDGKKNLGFYVRGFFKSNFKFDHYILK